MMKRPEACTIVIFGATGDLTRRKLAPALYYLMKQGLMPEEFAIIGCGRKKFATEEFRDHLKSEITPHIAPAALEAEGLNAFIGRWEYLAGDMAEDSIYRELGGVLERVTPKAGARNILYYLATPPQYFGEVATRLGRHGLAQEKEGEWRRFVFEKPFGHDLASARELNRMLDRVLAERQIYRIDHYLGKETVQNLMVLRFANGLLEPVWNRKYIDSVQITVAESVGLEGRAGYYDHAGALRDMVQSHLLQVLSLIGMEPPYSFDGDAVRDERAKLLRSVRPLSPEAIRNDVVRARYEGYEREPGVPADSRAETFAALRLHVDSWRWAGVPFYLRTGKRLAAKSSQVLIQFQCAPLQLFRHTEADCSTANRLLIGIQPEERVSLQISAKVPGPGIQARPVDLSFCYADYFHKKASTGYETLIYDCMSGDTTLFLRQDQVLASWEIITPILKAWERDRDAPLPAYAQGSWGPEESSALLARDGRAWQPEETTLERTDAPNLRRSPNAA